MTDKLSNFRPASRNANKHTQRGIRELERAVQEDGWVAPVTVAADGESLDGSARLEVAADKFDDDVLVVHHDGTKPVIMVRDDVENAETIEARRIALRANRVAQLNLDFDMDVIIEDLDAGVDFTGLFTDEELFGEVSADMTLEEIDLDALPERPIWALMTIQPSALHIIKPMLDAVGAKDGVELEFSEDR